MSGHSKWSTIKHQKGAKDARRGKLFARLIRAIEVAAREGGSNPEGNPTLADAIQKAKDNSVPSETIDRAVKRGAGELAGQKLERQTYEGYAPGGVAVLIEALTDNRNRTAAEIRRAFNRAGGSLADAGSVAYLFTRKGEVIVPGAAAEEDRVLEVALEAGADDVVGGSAGFTVTTEPSALGAVRAAFEAGGIAFESAQVTMVPSVSVQVEGEDAHRVLRLLDAIEDLDDVQDVYANFDISDEVMAQVS
ncbi:MAG TPA: YebC/PmpR family DNA-binding transcriptional regulator [Actinomycetes bacterium]|nr:YebC/PmpR family DNA-binding transcriptional regulator [Actinomycetes bacterium]